MTIQEFIIAAKAAPTTGELFSAYRAAMATLGFDRVIFSLMTEHREIGKPAGHGIISNYPDDWMKHYVARGMQGDDPVRAWMYSALGGFAWSQIAQSQILTRSQAAVLNEGDEAGLHRGIGIPLRSAGGAIAGIGAASSDPHTEDSPRAVALASLLSAQFYAAFLELEALQARPAPPQLSPREREILQWIATGKTRQEISVILGISGHTVNAAISSVLRKLETNNVIVAAFKALHMSLIQI